MDSRGSTLPPAEAESRYVDGLVFGFDMGVGSIGWAVRQGNRFLDVGALICPVQAVDLRARRVWRRLRRTYRSRRRRRVWFARELAKVLGLQLHQRTDDSIGLCETAWEQNEAGGWIPKRGFESLCDPVTLRRRALDGDEIKPEELHAALSHLFKRRGYVEVLLKDRLEQNSPSTSTAESELNANRAKIHCLRKEMERRQCLFPCELLAKRRDKNLPQRRQVWPRDLLEEEFRAIVAAQAKHFPKLASRVDWLLYGDTHEVHRHHVYFKATEGRNPGVLGIKWPRSNNRAPRLDVLVPFDELGRPRHAARQDKMAFRQAQWELAMLKFRVIDVATGRRVQPDTKALARLRELWGESRSHTRGLKRSKASVPPGGASGSSEKTEVKVSRTVLERWAAEFADRYRLVEGQQALAPDTRADRALFSSPTLKLLRQTDGDTQALDPGQRVLCRPGETASAALDRYLGELRERLLCHRMILFRRLLADLVKRFGVPDLIVLETVPSLMPTELGRRNLQLSPYLARVIRRVAVLQLGWLERDGSEPTPGQENVTCRFQVTNAQLTKDLYRAWGLNRVLYALPSGKSWDRLPEAEQQRFMAKLHGDLRLHGLNAMVVACTPPSLTQRAHDQTGQPQIPGSRMPDKKPQGQSANPVFPERGSLRQICVEWIDRLVIRHHVSRSPHQKSYGTTVYAKKGRDIYVAREPLTMLSPKNLDNIWPPELAAYCGAAWARYATESPDLASELKHGHGCLPEAFICKLCFAHFQKWRATGSASFQWPRRVRIPIRRVKYIGVKSDMVVVPTTPGSSRFVKRTRFKEVRIHLSADGKSLVPVLIPWWKNDPPIATKPYQADTKPIMVVRRGQNVTSKNARSTVVPAGLYRVVAISQKWVKLLPAHVASNQDARTGILTSKNAYQPVWATFIAHFDLKPPQRGRELALAPY